MTGNPEVFCGFPQAPQKDVVTESQLVIQLSAPAAVSLLLCMFIVDLITLQLAQSRDGMILHRRSYHLWTELIAV